MQVCCAHMYVALCVCVCMYVHIGVCLQVHSCVLCAHVHVCVCWGVGSVRFCRRCVSSTFGYIHVHVETALTQVAVN
jgi:hypothetical protein